MKKQWRKNQWKNIKTTCKTAEGGKTYCFGSWERLDIRFYSCGKKLDICDSWGKKKYFFPIFTFSGGIVQFWTNPFLALPQETCMVCHQRPNKGLVIVQYLLSIILTCTHKGLMLCGTTSVAGTSVTIVQPLQQVLQPV